MKSPEMNADFRYSELTMVLLSILSEFEVVSDPEVLVIGAGTGREVLALCHAFAHVRAIDSETVSLVPAAKGLVAKGDATAIEFPDRSFDLVYCYHVLEHIPEKEKALLEIWRVLKVGGFLYVGVPNKSRLFSYFLIDDATFKKKLIWNINDWHMRFMGKWENHLGAHAGFTKSELSEILESTFQTVTDVTRRYYFFKYGRHHGYTGTLARFMALANWLCPSIYFVCGK
jgi:ubiquinone/menaquinone biosynthesis C-methylase UbiE